MPVGMTVCDVTVSVAEVAAERTVHVDIAGSMAVAVSDVDVAVDAAADVDVNDCDVDSDRITSNIWLSSTHEGSLLGDFDCPPADRAVRRLDQIPLTAPEVVWPVLLGRMLAVELPHLLKDY
ncbi:hypothetical protein R3I94_001074 [Phoxinus phoxinus]